MVLLVTVLNGIQATQMLIISKTREDDLPTALPVVVKP